MTKKHYFLAHVSVAYAKSEDEKSTVLSVNIPFASKTGYISQSALAFTNQLAMKHVADMTGEPEGLTIGDVLIQNIISLGQMTEEEWGDVDTPLKPASDTFKTEIN